MSVRSERMGSVAYSAVMFVVVSVLMGLLAAGLVVPFAAMAGTGSKAAASSLELLPEELETPPQPERSRVLANDGSVLAYFYDENRVVVPLEDIAPVMRQAQIAIEDHRFYEHGALDITGTLRAFLQNTAGGSTQGGSSITQQYVKMVQVEKAKSQGDEEGIAAAQESQGLAGYGRKLQEMRYAIALEKRLSKDEILQNYLNIAYYGDGAYGVEQASRHYFDTSAKDLTLAQAAMLAGLVQNPAATDPTRFPDKAIERRDVVIDRMASEELQLITPEEAEEAKATEWDPDDVQSPTNGCVGTEFPFLCDYVQKTMLQNEALGETAQERNSLLLRGGLTIKTQIDKDTQRAAEEAISDLIDPEDPVISTMSMIEPGTGLILAMAQSRPEMGTDPGQTYYNYAVPQSLGGAEGFQAGSTFKAFTAAAALDEGIPMSKRYNSPQSLDFGGTKYESCDGEREVPAGYRPKNSTRSGSMTMDYATEWSVNTYFLQLAEDTGLCPMTEMMEKLGVKLSSGEPITSASDIFSLTLGPVDITPLSMTEAYATFAADGVHCNPTIVDTITTTEGTEIEVPGADCEQVIDEDVARGVTSLLEGVMDATGAPARLDDDDHDIAGKTGTTDSTEAVWFCGFSPEVAGCASIAVDKTNGYWEDRNRSLEGLRLPSSGNVLNGSGGGDAGASIWKPAMEKALEGRPTGEFEDPSSDIRNGKTVDVPSVAGLSAQEAQEKLEEAGFRVTRANTPSTAPAGTYLGISSVSQATVSSSITMYFSSGPPPRPAPRDDDSGGGSSDDEDSDDEDSGDSGDDSGNDEGGDSGNDDSGNDDSGNDDSGDDDSGDDGGNDDGGDSGNDGGGDSGNDDGGDSGDEGE